MKQLIIISLMAISFASCKKCYTCSTTVTYYPASAGGTSTSTTQFCGTAKQKDEYVKSGTSTTHATSGGVSVTVISTTTCE